MADASHELKTPLTVILANLKILLAHPDETIKSQQRWIQNTQEEASRMQNLVKNLLFLARSEEEPLPQDELSRLFDRFYRADKSRSKKEKGYGLGLSIALRIIKGHHGKIRVTSDVENGTCFAVYLPLCSKKT